MSTTNKLNDGLSDLGSLIQFGLSQIPIVGGFLSKIVSIIWPEEKTDIWSSIKQDVKNLIDEEIDDTEWNLMLIHINVFQYKVSQLNATISTGDYETAGAELIDLFYDTGGFQDNFKLNGNTFKYAFAPLYVAAVNLRLGLYLEGIKYSSEFGLNETEINLFHNTLKKDVEDAKSYLAPIHSAIGDTYLNDIQTYFSVGMFYGASVCLFNALWSGDYEDYISPKSLENFYIPVIAAGSFYKLINLDGTNYSVPMGFADVEQNAAMPSTNIEGVLYQEPTAYPSGFLNYIDIYTDLSTLHRTTGVMFTCSGSTEQYEMGMTPNNDESFNVGQNTLSIDVDGGEFVNEVSIISEEFVSQISFTTNRNNTMVAGQQSNTTPSSATLINPFTVNSMYVVSDTAGYIQSSGHQICGIAIAAIYNNQLAKAYVNNLSQNNRG